MKLSITALIMLNSVLLFSENLIKNSGCESALVSGNIPFWTEELGTAWTQRTAEPAPYEGGAYFFAGDDALNKLTQTIDVKEFAAEIDAGVQEFSFTGMVRSYDQVPVDQSQIEVEYWDNSQTTMLDFFDSGLHGNTADWELVSDRRFAPTGTRYIKIRLTSKRNSGTNNDGYFDDLHLDAIPRTEILPMLFENIVKNPGCESALVSENIPFWTEELGTAWTQRTAGPDPYEGGAYFFAGSDALNKLTQTIDVKEFATEIDAGVQEFLFRGMVRSYAQYPVDQSQIEVEYWDNSQTTMLDSFDSGLHGNTEDWELVSDRRYAPIGTRYIKIRLTSKRNSGDNNDGYFDDLKLNAIMR